MLSLSAKKQPKVARSSAEAEYRALASAAAEMTWVSYILRDLDVFLPTVPLLLFCDNKSTTYMASNPVFHARTKHIELDYHFVREKVLGGSLRVQFLPSPLQLAYIFTKSLPRGSLLQLRSKLGVQLHPTHNLQEGDKDKHVEESLTHSVISTTISTT